MTRAAPATPPTIPPTRTGVGGVLLPPDPLPELVVGEGAAAVLPEPPTPPAPMPELEGPPEFEDAEPDWLESCDDTEDVSMVGVEVICAEDIPELRPWLLRVEVANPLGL